MAVTPTVLTSGTQTSGTSSATTASISPAAKSLVLLAVYSSQQTVSSISGAGLTFNLVANPTNGTAGNLSLYVAQVGNSPSSGGISVFLNTAAANTWGWQVIQITGHDPAIPINQCVTAVTASGNTFNVTLASPTNSNSRSFFVGITLNAATYTVKANWTELSAITAGAKQTFEWRSDGTFDTAAGATVGGFTAYTVIGFEIVAAPPSRWVYTRAGSGGTGSSDGFGTTANLTAPQGLAYDPTTGSVYFCDGHAIRKISPSGLVSTIAGAAATSGSTDSAGTSARFNLPYGLTVDASGNIFVADSGNNKIRKIVAATGVVSTFAGGATSGFANGTGTAATFNQPYGITIDASGNFYVADANNNAIRKITSAGVVTTLAGSGSSGTPLDGNGSAARFAQPRGITYSSSANCLYVADTNNAKVRVVTLAGDVTTIATQINFVQFLATKADGNLLVLALSNATVRQLTPGGVLTTYAGTGTAGSASGDAVSTAQFANSAGGLAVDTSGNVWVGDVNNYLVRIISNPPTVFVTDTDTASFAGAESLHAYATGAETASFTESEAIIVHASGGDGATFTETEQVNVHAFPVSDADTAAFTEGQSVSVHIYDSDSASFSDTVGRPLRIGEADVATFTEAESIRSVKVADGETLTVTEGQSVARWFRLFETPTTDEYGQFGTDRLFGRYRLTQGVTVAIKDGMVYELTFPYQGDLEEYDSVYLGGRTYRVTDRDEAALINAGYSDNLSWSADV